VIDLPEGMPAPTMGKLRKARVCGRPLEIKVYKESEVPQGGAGAPRRAPRRTEGQKDGFAKKPHRGKPRDNGAPAPGTRAPRKRREA